MVTDKWQGGFSEKANELTRNISDNLAKVMADLDNADHFIESKATAFNELRFHTTR